MIFTHVSGKNGVVNLAVNGSVEEIAGELSLMIHQIYSELAKKDRSDADDFKRYIRATINEDFLFQKKSEDVLSSVRKATLKNILRDLAESLGEDEEDNDE